MKGILAQHDTFPKLLLRNAERLGDRNVAMREKEFGIWQEFTWKEYHDHVKYFSLGLTSLGLSPGDKVAIIGDNRPEWVWAEVAAQAAGAVPKGRYVVYSDPRGMRGYKEPCLLDFKEVENFGRELEEREPGLYPNKVAAGKMGDLALICYTSGTTGFPKGAMLSFRNLLTMAANLMEVDPKFQTDEFVSFLPLAWIGEQMMCLSSALLTGFTVNFPEKPETVQEKVMDASRLKRTMYNWALPVGYEYADTIFRKQHPGPLLKLKHRLAYYLVFRALKDRLGLLGIRTAPPGGAALGPDVFQFFKA